MKLLFKRKKYSKSKGLVQYLNVTYYTQMDTTYWTYSMCTFIIFEHLKSSDYGMLADAHIRLDFLEANLVSKTRRTIFMVFILDGCSFHVAQE